MKELIILRTENQFYICSDKENKFFAIEIKEMPEEIKIGDKIQINNEGEISKK